VTDTLESALKQIQEKTFDAILLDLNLPDSRGMSTLQTIQQEAPMSAIVVLTSTDDEQLALQLIQMGAQDYLIKQETNDHVLIRGLNYATRRKQSEIALQYKNLELAAANEALAKNTAQLAKNNQILQEEIAQRQDAEVALQKLAADLENRVQERTLKLVASNKKLKQEIQDRQQVEAALRQREDYLRGMFEQNDAVKLLLNGETGEILDANPAAAEFYGYSLSEMIFNKNLTDLDVRDPEQTIAELQRMLKQQSSYCQGSHRLASGDVRQVELYASPLVGQEKPVVFAIVHDITHRLRMESAMRNIAVGLNSSSSQGFFESLVKYLAKACEVEYAFVSELVDGKPDHLQTVAAWANDRVVENFDYAIAHTPCETVLRKGRKIYPQGLKQQFPLDQCLVEFDAESYASEMLVNSRGNLLGLICVLGRQKMKNPDLIQEILSIFARRVSGELERAKTETKLQSYAERQRLLNQTALKIQQSLNLPDILNTTVDEVRQLLDCDRVLVYQLAPDLSGTIMAESVAPGWLVTLGTDLEDTCFRSGGAVHYQEGMKTALDNVDEADHLSDCYRELLAQFQVKANLVVPILLPVRSGLESKGLENQGAQSTKVLTTNLWGLLIAHQCSGPRHWQQSELELLNELAVQLAIAIQQAELYAQAQTELQQRRQAEEALRKLNQDLEQEVLQRTAELQASNDSLSAEVAQRQQAQAELEQQYIKSSLFGQITAKIRSSLKLEEVLQTAVAEIQGVLECDRVLMYQVFNDNTGRVVAEVARPPYAKLLDMEFPEETFPPECWEKYRDGSIVAIDDVNARYGELWPCLLELLETWQVQAKLVVPIWETLKQNQLWGFIIAHHCAEPHHWSEFEQELIGQLANQVSVAVHQASLIKSQQDALQAWIHTQQELDNLFNSTNDLIQIISLETNQFAYVNRAWMETLEYDNKDLSQISYVDVISPEYREQFVQLCDRFKAGQIDRLDAVEVAFIGKQGRTIFVEGDITSRITTDRQVVVQAIFRDVTERRKTQVQLQRALQELAYQKEALDEMAVVAMTDAEGMITYVNDKFCELSGYSRAEAIGQTHRLINSGYHPRSFFAELWSTISRGKIWRGEICNRAKDGHLYWEDTTIVPFLDAEGKPLQYLAIRVDITDRKLAEEGLRQQLAAVEAAIDGIGILHDQRYIFLNQAHAQLFGYHNAEELIGQSWHILYQPDEVERIEQEVFPVLMEQKHWQGEAVGTRVDGSIFPQELSLTLNEDGDLICVCRDISDRKKADRQLRHALAKAQELNELKSRFVSMTSHEFRTPLTTILGAAEILKYYGHQWNDEKKMKYLDRIYSTVKHMTGMLDDVLLLGRIESGRIELQPVAIDICEFTQSLVEELTIGIGKDHQIILSCGRQSQAGVDHPVYNLDEKILRHILINLLTNAIKYSPENSMIQFQVNVENQDRVTFQIKDQGIGIPVEDQKHLFESFHRAENVGNIQGTGLGLSIVKKSVDLHQGEIYCHSEVNQGSTFTVTLPSIYIY
jgi:PAS domain S-box-containing protein